MFRNGIASGKRVDAHIIVNNNGPTQSVITLLKGSSKAGIGLNGAFEIL